VARTAFLAAAEFTGKKYFWHKKRQACRPFPQGASARIAAVRFRAKSCYCVPVMTLLQYCELMFYVVETFALPFAIVVFILEQRKERQSEEEEIFQRLSDEYREFLKLVLDNTDLHLLGRAGSSQNFTDDQKERRHTIFGILVSLFERAYLLVYEEHMDKQTRRMWQSWEDYMREWVRRAEFREALPQLLEGEDEEFTRHIQKLAEAERK
jgi:hypothetical protein